MAAELIVALALAPPMRAFYLATEPLVDLFNGVQSTVVAVDDTRIAALYSGVT